MGHKAKENKRFMNSPPTRAEVSEFMKKYHEDAIQSAIRIILMLLTETGVIQKDNLDAFMTKVHEMTKVDADKPE